jgi:hypothetical protein
MLRYEVRRSFAKAFVDATQAVAIKPAIKAYSTRS